MNYVNLMRIKACETGENRELEYQIRVAKVILFNFGIDIGDIYEPEDWYFLTPSLQSP